MASPGLQYVAVAGYGQIRAVSPQSQAEPTMRLALLAGTYCKGMGYLENMLPKYLARIGVETHLVAMDLPPYYWLRDFPDTYGNFVSQSQSGTVENHEGYTLHIVGHKKIAGYARMVGLREKLSLIRPDIVQASVCIGWIALDAALYKGPLGYKLFTGNHYHASVFPLAKQAEHWWSSKRLHCTLTRTVPGRLVGLVTEKCYAIAPDCADVATRFFGVPRSKVEICPLGVDTELFGPISSEKDRQARLQLRERLGFAASDILCVYTGRFSEDKNPLLLAQAVAVLASAGQPYRGLFVGKGKQGEAIESCRGCVTHPFVSVHQLPDIFRAADIAVWPAQESLSMLDAAACGLPIVANHTMTARERIDGNGSFYRLNDGGDLIRVLLGLRDQSTRQYLGTFGAQKVARKFSWQAIAERRLADYESALRIKTSLKPKAAMEPCGRLD
jgi:glycosyltransferase involved in cell wall biosynthesis